MFAVVKYRKVLENICADRGINVNFRHNLIELNYGEREAVFEVLDESGNAVETRKQQVLSVSTLFIIVTQSLQSNCFHLRWSI